jgi:hypothetical protein
MNEKHEYLNEKNQRCFLQKKSEGEKFFYFQQIEEERNAISEKEYYTLLLEHIIKPLKRKTDKEIMTEKLEKLGFKLEIENHNQFTTVYAYLGEIKKYELMFNLCGGLINA